METARDAKTHLYAMDPAATLFTFLLRTDPSVNTVRLLGSWDNFAMTYAMERDSRRDRGQWRGCHTFNNIICDGDAPAANQTPRSGGLKMGHDYYYYKYELDGSTETHDPAVPSTTTCPYLPGQRVNTLWVPVEKSSRQRSASVNSMRRSDFRTMNPADKFVTPRPPPATPLAAPAAGPELKTLASSVGRPLSPLPSPRHLLRRQRSVRSLSPAPSLSSWSPRRLFVRRASPSREVTPADTQQEDDELEHFADGDDALPQEQAPQRPLPPPRLASSSSTSSFSSLSRLRHAALAPSTAVSSAASQRSRSRDISPESLRRFLVDDVPLEGASYTTQDGSISTAAAAVDTAVNRTTNSCITEAADEDDHDSHDLDFIDDDEHNFATSAASESAPVTILSPPPPPSRTVTPPKPREDTAAQELEEKQVVISNSVAAATEAEPSILALPEKPTRSPPAIPALPLTERPESASETGSDVGNSAQLDMPQLSLNLDLPAVLSPPSPMSLSPMSSSLSSSLSFQSPESHGLSSVAQSDTTDDEEDGETFYGVYGSSGRLAAGEPLALFLPPPEHPFQVQSGGSGSNSSSSSSRDLGYEHTKSASQQEQQNHHRHHLVAAALTGSTATLVPGNGVLGADSGSGLSDLVDELGWMATAIQG